MDSRDSVFIHNSRRNPPAFAGKCLQRAPPARGAECRCELRALLAGRGSAAAAAAALQALPDFCPNRLWFFLALRGIAGAADLPPASLSAFALKLAAGAPCCWLLLLRGHNSPHFSPLPPIYQVELYAERVNNRGLSACSQAESLKFKLVQVPHHHLFFLHNKPRAPPPSYQPTAGPRCAPRVLQRSALHHGERCKGRSGDALLRRSAVGFWLLLTCCR